MGLDSLDKGNKKGRSLQITDAQLVESWDVISTFGQCKTDVYIQWKTVNAKKEHIRQKKRNFYRRFSSYPGP